MLVLAISGSPRKLGNTELLLNEAVRGARKAGATVDVVRLHDLAFAPCRECGSCERNGICVQQDAMQGLYPKLLQMDGIILAAPVFFMGLPAHAKAFVDRCQPLWAMKYRLGRRFTDSVGALRRGAFMSVGGTRFPHTFDGSVRSIKALFTVIDVEYRGELVVRGVDGKGDILKHESEMKRALELGRTMAS